MPSALCASWLLPSAVKCPTPQALRPEAGARASCARQRLFPQRSCLLCVRVNLTCICASAMCAGLVLAIGVGLIGIGLLEPTLYVCLMCVLGYWICAGDWRPIDRYRVCARLRRVQGLGFRVEGLGFSFFRVWALTPQPKPPLNLNPQPEMRVAAGKAPDQMAEEALDRASLVYLSTCRDSRRIRAMRSCHIRAC